MKATKVMKDHKSHDRTLSVRLDQSITLGGLVYELETKLHEVVKYIISRHPYGNYLSAATKVNICLDGYYKPPSAKVIIRSCNGRLILIVQPLEQQMAHVSVMSFIKTLRYVLEDRQVGTTRVITEDSPVVYFSNDLIGDPMIIKGVQDDKLFSCLRLHLGAQFNF